MKNVLFLIAIVFSVAIYNSPAHAADAYPPLYPGVIAEDGVDPFVFPEVEDPFSTDNSPFPCWLVNFTSNPCEYPAILLDSSISQADKDAYVCDVLQSINARYACSSHVYPTVAPAHLPGTGSQTNLLVALAASCVLLGGISVLIGRHRQLRYATISN